MPQPAFLAKPMNAMSAAEWESLCDGCGLCCQISLEDEDTGEVTLSDAACRYLCLNTHRCLDYLHRQTNVPECIKVTPENIHSFTWLPETCGYRRVATGKDLPVWHHLICGDKQRVHTDGPSRMGQIFSEDDAVWE